MASIGQPPARHGDSRLRRAIDVIDDRLGIRALEYPVPEHANNLTWSLGGITAGAFVVLIATGILLVQFYAPVPESANASVRGAHVVIIPGLILVLFTLHALLVKRHRISPHPRLTADDEAEQAPAGEPTEPFTHHLRRIAALGLALTGLLGILAVLVPPAVGPPPVEGLEITKPPWNFWWMFTLENWLGLSSILYGGGLLFLLLVALPFVDRNPHRDWRHRPVAMVLGLLILLAVATLTILMAFTAPETHLGM